MKLKKNLALIDSSISYEEIKTLVNDTSFITFDYASHLLLTKKNIKHEVSDSFLNSDELDFLQEKVYEFSNWHYSERVTSTLFHKNVNLGSLFYIELWMFLIPLTKKFFEIIKIVEKYNVEKIVTSYLICELGKCLQLEFTNLSSKTANIDYYYDSLKFETDIFSLKLSPETFSKLKNLSEKILNPFVNSSKNPSKKNILLVEFNTINSEKLLYEFSKNNIDVTSYCRRRPAIWNSRSLSIIRKSNSIVPNFSDLIDDQILENTSKVCEKKIAQSKELFEDAEYFKDFFKINNSSFWNFLKPYLIKLFEKRLNKSIFEIELAEKALKTNRPDYVLIQSESGNTEQIILSLSKKLNIPVILLQHGFLKSSKGGFKFNQFTKTIIDKSDIFIVWGHDIIDNLKNHGVNSKNIHALGSFMHDNIFKSKNHNNKKEHLLLVTEGPIMVDVRDYKINELEEYRRCLIHIFQTAKNLNKKLVVKLHPYETDYDEKTLAKKIDPKISVKKKQNIQSLIESSELVISLGTSISTAVIDAIIMNKPVIRLQFGEWYGDFGDGSCLNVEKNNFHDTLTDLLSNPKFRNEIIKNQKNFLNEYLVNPGTATENIISYIKSGPERSS
tara:strand:+ start:7467 stop:9308 length:1842 start_codon:yes stop_codon:yes gene_type:complete